MVGKSRIIVVSFLEPKPLAFKFSNWPNHITLVPYFNSTNPEGFIKEVKGLCQNIDKISYQVGLADYFGPRKNVKVSLVNLLDQLLNFHNSLLSIALKYDKNMRAIHCRSNFKPHITHHNTPFPQEKDEKIVKEIYVVKDLSDKSKNKKIIGIINLR